MNTLHQQVQAEHIHWWHAELTMHRKIKIADALPGDILEAFGNALFIVVSHDAANMLIQYSFIAKKFEVVTWDYIAALHKTYTLVVRV